MRPPSRRPGHGYPIQENIPSQRPANGIPYMPGTNQADVGQFPPLQKQHKPGYGGPPPVYVVSTFDARPVNAVDFSTYTGTNRGGAANPDTGFLPTGGPYTTASLFYEVQPGRTAVIRDWHVLAVPAAGFDIGELNPVLATNGASNFMLTLSFLVNGVFQESMSALALWALPFGDVFGDAYIIAQPGDIIEMRLTGGPAGGVQTQNTFHQAIMAMHGNLLQTKGYQPQFEPATDAILPVHESAVRPLNQPAEI